MVVGFGQQCWIAATPISLKNVLYEVIGTTCSPSLNTPLSNDINIDSLKKYV
jgi:hypothetical protein